VTARDELMAERAKLATWVAPIDRVPQFSSAYCIWLVDLARRALAEQDETVRSLQAELDLASGRNVMMVPHGYHLQAQAATPLAPDGTVMRDMATGQEWVYLDGRWEDQR